MDGNIQRQDEVDFFQIASSDASIDAKFQALYQLANDIGFGDIFYARLIDSGHNTPRIQSNVFSLRIGDQEWQRIYEGENFAPYDWAREYSSEAYMPYRLDQPPPNLTKRQAEFVGHARIHQRQNGFAFPIRGAFGLIAGFSATAAPNRPTEVQIARLTSAAQFFDLMVGATITNEAAQLYSLTDREIRLLRLYITGRSMAQIAAMLGRSEQWIRRSFLRMRSKTKVTSNSELVYRASRMQII